MKLNVTVNGTTYDVEVEVLDAAGEAAAPAAPKPAPRPAAAAPKAPAPAAPAAPKAAPAPAAAGANTLTSPIPGTVVEINVSVGQQVAAKETVLVIDAMKMNTPIASTTAGKVKQIHVNPGDSVQMGQVLVTFE